MKYECSCGVVLYRKNKGSYEYLLIKDRNNNWSFPKGHVKIGETPEFVLNEKYMKRWD